MNKYEIFFTGSGQILNHVTRVEAHKIDIVDGAIILRDEREETTFRLGQGTWILIKKIEY